MATTQLGVDQERSGMRKLMRVVGIMAALGSLATAAYRLIGMIRRKEATQ